MAKKSRRANAYTNFNKAITKYFKTHVAPFRKSERTQWCSNQWTNFAEQDRLQCRTQIGADALIQLKYRDAKGIPEIVKDPKVYAVGRSAAVNESAAIDGSAAGNESAAIDGSAAGNESAAIDGSAAGTSSQTHHSSGEQRDAELFNKGYTADELLTIKRGVMQKPLPVLWTDIVGLNDMKDRLFEATTMPIVFPNFFTGIRAPYRGVLLFGPPGTGKTMAVKAVVTDCNSSGRSCAFFNLKPSSILNPYQGIAEKNTLLIFDMAKAYAPSIILIDELDCLCSKRGLQESGSNKRVLSEILVQMDGIDTSDPSCRVLVIGATNRPWDLDEALIRRFEKRLYIPPPNTEARLSMIEKNLAIYPKDGDVNLVSVAAALDGFTGDDIWKFCREVAMMPMRDTTMNMARSDVLDLAPDALEGRIKQSHFELIKTRVKRSIDQNMLNQHIAWNETFGSN